MTLREIVGNRMVELLTVAGFYEIIRLLFYTDLSLINIL